MRSRETALGATIRFFERYAGIDRAGKTHRPSGPGLPDGGVGVLPDAVPDRLLGAWIADDVCACEAFFIEGKTKSEPCGLPERGALPVFAFACACGLYFARGGRLADVPEPGRPEVWLLFLQFQTVLRLVRAARIRGVSPPPVDVFGFERYPETVRRPVSRGLRRTRAAEVPAQLGASSGAVFAPEPDARFRRRESRVAQRGRRAGIDLRTESERPVSRILKNAISVRGCRTVLFLMSFGISR